MWTSKIHKKIIVNVFMHCVVQKIQFMKVTMSEQFFYMIHYVGIQIISFMRLPLSQSLVCMAL